MTTAMKAQSLVQAPQAETDVSMQEMISLLGQAQVTTYGLRKIIKSQEQTLALLAQQMLKQDEETKGLEEKLKAAEQELTDLKRQPQGEATVVAEAAAAPPAA